jgi:hypothetical protein
MSNPFEPTPGEIIDELAEQRRRDFHRQRVFANLWNHKHEVGTPVTYTQPDGSKLDTTTASAAEVHGCAAIQLVGVADWVALQSVEAR